MGNTPAPVTPRERILALDVLRGFALLGVLVAYAMWSLGTAPEAAWSPLDRTLGELVGFLVDGKFYTILAFLFGLGFSIQLGRAGNDRVAVESYCRRLAVLAAFGLVHALTLRNGDILLPYALTGFLLIPFRHASARSILVVALAALLVGHAARLLWEFSGAPLPQRPQLEDAPYLVENAEWVRYWLRLAPFSWPLNLTLFLFGLLAGRLRIISALTQQPRRLVAILVTGLAAGTLLYFAQRAFSEASAPSALTGQAASLLFTFHCWSMSSAYAAALLLALRSPAGASALPPLSAIGRLALTNYLLQAGLIVPICLIFGLFDRFTPTTSLLLAFSIFLLVQLPFSMWWLKRFQFGPVEWLWRRLTYGRSPPMRLAA